MPLMKTASFGLVPWVFFLLNSPLLNQFLQMSERSEIFELTFVTKLRTRLVKQLLQRFSLCHPFDNSKRWCVHHCCAHRLGRPAQSQLSDWEGYNVCLLGMSCPDWQWHRTGSRWSPIRTLPVAPLWCDLGFSPNSRGNKAAANLRVRPTIFRCVRCFGWDCKMSWRMRS